MKLYETAALFNQNMSNRQQEGFADFYRHVFSGYNITTIHDCSIGAGGTTLPLAELGYRVSGSDLSENLLKKAKENFAEHGHDIELCVCDFRKLSERLVGAYDCIISTGNSLPHINNQDVSDFIRSVSAKINRGGLLYVDMRNWDMNLNEKPIFTAHDPLVMTAEKHVSLYQVWNWHDDETVNFVFVTSTDIEGRHEKTRFVHAPTYYPLRYRDYERMLSEHGFEIRGCFDVDHLWFNDHGTVTKTGDFEADFDKIRWYAVLAQKVR